MERYCAHESLDFRGLLAERVGFEPTVRITAQRLSSSKILMLARATM